MAQTNSSTSTNHVQKKKITKQLTYSKYKVTTQPPTFPPSKKALIKNIKIEDYCINGKLYK